MECFIRCKTTINRVGLGGDRSSQRGISWLMERRAVDVKLLASWKNGPSTWDIAGRRRASRQGGTSCIMEEQAINVGLHGSWKEPSTWDFPWDIVDNTPEQDLNVRLRRTWKERHQRGTSPGMKKNKDVST